MSTIPGRPRRAKARALPPSPAQVTALPLPPWVEAGMGEEARRVLSRTKQRTIEVCQSAGRSLVSIRVQDAAACTPEALQRHTHEAYRTAADILRDLPARHPIRFWNFMPDISGRAGDGLDRYMMFNAGRFAAFKEWFGDVDSFDQRVATSTGVGHDADELLIHVLAADKPGLHVMNSRQVAPRRYSQTYGPVPPCFARATVVPDATRAGWCVLVGGTAAVRGERSVGGDNLETQTAETIRNMAWLLRTMESSDPAQPGRVRGSNADACRAFESLRVYYRRVGDEAALRAMMAERFGQVTDAEYLRSDMCRSELLVEIEGTAFVAADA
jgi:chorismate lyase/3-hydroxybenzoate synthase